MTTLPPGVPALPAGSGSLFSTPMLMSGDSVSATVAFGAPEWGIFDQNHNAVITFDAALSFDFAQDWKVSSYPIEGGSFTTYNKVQDPIGLHFVLAQGGTVAQRSAFLSTLTAISNSYDLYNVVIPETTYLNQTITADRYGRGPTDGATLIKMRISLEEVRQTATATFSQTVQPAAADQVNTGSVQTQPTTPQQQSALSSLFGP